MQIKMIAPRDLAIPKRKRSSHKGENGRVLVIGGSEDYAGAPALAGIAALRSGADWVTVAAPEDAGWAIHCYTPDLVVRKFRCAHFTAVHAKPLLSLAKKHDVVLIGNGIGGKSGSMVKAFLAGYNGKVVIDADALASVTIQKISHAILTPHAGEFSRLLTFSHLAEHEFQGKLRDNVLLFKGMVDRIYTAGEVFTNKTGNPGMTKAGTGDVLAGIAAGYYAQGLTAVQAAINAAYINGKIGDILLRKKHGYFFLASDLVEELERFNRFAIARK